MKLPDDPQTPPFLQLIQWITSPLEYLETSAQRYGDTFTAQWGDFPPFMLLSIVSVTPTGFRPPGVRGDNFFADSSKLTNSSMLRFSNAGSNLIHREQTSSRGVTLAPPGGMQMVVTSQRSQNYGTLQTSSNRA